MNEENSIAKTEEKTELIEYDIEDIKHKIYTIRGKQVMLDSDVAELYGYTTKNINKAMKRNIERFPEDFCFQIKENEIENLRFQIGTSSSEEENHGGRRYQPYVYTEQGIAMLSGVLRNETAIKVSINIIRAFIELRKFITLNGQVLEKLANMENNLTSVNYKLLDHDKKFDIIFDELQSKKEHEENQRIFFEGQIWDAYNLIINIIKKADQKILIIDNYIDDTILEMLAKKNPNVEVIILTSNNSNISRLDIQKFNKEYPTLKLAKTNKFHDRFIVIDNKELYHCGASLKDLGKKCFAINKILDSEYIEKINSKTSG